MRTGRPKKPIPIRAVEGDLRKIGSKKLAQQIEQAYKAPRGIPATPDGLDPVALKHYEYLAYHLHRGHLLAESDEGSLVSAATAYSAMMRAHKAKDINSLDKAIGRYMQMADRLGLHESARAKFTKKDMSTDAIGDLMCG